MANLKRSSKSGNDWTPNDLHAYNIRVEYQDSPTFFGMPVLPQPQVDTEVLTAPDSTATHHDESYALLRTMESAMVPVGGVDEESAVDDFAVLLFKQLHYVGRDLGRAARTKKNISFLVCGELQSAQTDVCILDASNHVLLLVQEDKWHVDGPDPVPQLIAEAIAAFSTTNTKRLQALGKPPIDSKVFPGITMRGTMPTFYKIPVTAALVNAVQFGDFPEQETVVYAHVPSLPRPARRFSEGMRPLDNRHIVLSCYEAFRQFL